MKVFRLQSRTNPRVKSLVKEKNNFFVFEGDKLVRDIMSRGLDINLLIIREKEEGTWDVSSAKQNAKQSKIHEVWYVSETVMSKLSALKEPPDAIAMLALKEQEVDFENSRFVLGLDNIQDPANAGTVFRCAAAFGADAVVFSGESVKPTNSKFLRAAQDAVFDVPHQTFKNAQVLTEKAREAGINIYLTSSRQENKPSVTPQEIQLPALVLIGNEGHGLAPALFEDFEAVTIPQTDKVESLNAGVSACIIMYECMK